MILWSKGLGKLVLNMRLAERSSTGGRDGNLVVDGTMGPPTHWDYSVKMSEDDVLDFVDLLKQPAPVRYLIEGETPGAVVRTALRSGIAFAWNTARCFLGRPPSPTETPQDTTPGGNDTNEQRSATERVGDHGRA
jgi:hypothetical protein